MINNDEGMIKLSYIFDAHISRETYTNVDIAFDDVLRGKLYKMKIFCMNHCYRFWMVNLFFNDTLEKSSYVPAIHEYIYMHIYSCLSS